MNTPDTEWEKNTQERLVELLHNFNLECVKEPYDGEPLHRRARKNHYVTLIQDEIHSLLSSRDTYWKERVEEIMKLDIGDCSPTRTALQALLDNLK